MKITNICINSNTVLPQLSLHGSWKSAFSSALQMKWVSKFVTVCPCLKDKTVSAQTILGEVPELLFHGVIMLKDLWLDQCFGLSSSSMWRSSSNSFHCSNGKWFHDSGENSNSLILDLIKHLAMCPGCRQWFILRLYSTSPRDSLH